MVELNLRDVEGPARFVNILLARSPEIDPTTNKLSIDEFGCFCLVHVAHMFHDFSLECKLSRPKVTRKHL